MDSGAYRRKELTILSGETETSSFLMKDREVVSLFWPAVFDGNGVNVLDCSMVGEGLSCCNIFRSANPPTSIVHIPFKASGVVGLEPEDVPVIQASFSLKFQATETQLADRTIWLQCK